MILNRRQLWILWLGVGLFVMAFVWHGYFSGEQNLERYQSTIENHLHKMERKADAILSDKDFIDQRLQEQFVGTDFKKDFTRLDNLKLEPFNICIFKNKKLVFWTRHDVIPLESDFSDTLSNKTISKFVFIKESQFELRYTHFWDANGQSIISAALIPLKKIYSTFEGEYLKNHFSASSFIPVTILLTSDAKQKQRIKTLEGKPLCYLSNSDTENDFVHDLGMSIFLILGFVLLGIVGDKIAKQMLKQYNSPAVGAVFFITVMSLLRLCIYWIQNSGMLPYLLANTSDFQSATFIRSLPELVIATSFLFWFSVFFNKDFILPDYKDLNLWLRWTLAAAFNCIIVLLLILCIGVFNDLVTSWDNLLSFDNLSDFEIRSLFTLSIVGIMMLSIFLITHKLIMAIYELNLTNFQHFLAVDVAVTLGIVMFQTYKLELPSWMYILLIFLYIGIFHNFIRYKTPGLIWLVQWVLAFSAIQAFFIARFNDQKDDKIIRNYAKNLARERDTLAERHIRLLSEIIAEDKMITTSSYYPIRADKDPQRVKELINEHFNSDEYLGNHYALRLIGFYQNNESFIGDSLSLYSWGTQYEKGYLYDRTSPNIRFWTNRKGEFAYLSSIKIPAMPDNPMYIGMEIKRDDKLTSPVTSELLVNNHYKAMKHLNDFSYAIYKNGTCTEQNLIGIYNKFISLPKSLNKEVTTETIVGNRNELVYQNTEGVVVKIGKERSLTSQVFSLWMFIILILFLLLFLLAFTNHFIRFLPDVVGFNFTISFTSSLRNRILFPSISFILLSYFAIFVYTTRYFKNIAEKYYTADLESKSSSIINNIVKELVHLRKDEGRRRVDPDSVRLLLERYSQSHQSSMHFFDKKGEMYATTEPNIFDRGIISKRMNSMAYMKLKSGADKEFKGEGSLGNLHYKTAYFTIQDSSDIVGFLELPYYSNDRKMRVGVAEIWTSNAIILTLLFIIGICIINIQTNKNVTPLQNIAEHLKKLELGKKSKNEMITTWDKKDEIGTLIDAYNTKVTQLEDTYSKIQEIEREDAWRDMAKQVAHEIRNPLTPMKLIVQHLEMIRKQRPDNLEEYLIRSNKVLLDQIDNLEKIVSEFANFAKMPQKATNELFVINDLVSSVSSLFSQYEDGENVKCSLHIPEERYIVYADRALMTSALNNLAKNAIQALPADRPGRIMVSLFRRNSTAIIRINDNGVGIPKDIQDKIFTPNFTTKQYGSGIGLLITKNIIQSVNGKIYFETSENEGTDFFVELDIQDVEKFDDKQMEVDNMPQTKDI
jgi:two-component system, NtrC family, nitrogen regulation sensor histidine kinase NtrY